MWQITKQKLQNYDQSINFQKFSLVFQPFAIADFKFTQGQILFWFFLKAQCLNNWLLDHFLRCEQETVEKYLYSIKKKLQEARGKVIKSRDNIILFSSYTFIK